MTTLLPGESTVESNNLRARPVLMLAFGEDDWLDGGLREWALRLVDSLISFGFQIQIVIRSVDSVSGSLQRVLAEIGCDMVPLSPTGETISERDFVSGIESVSSARNVRVLFAIGESISDGLAQKNLSSVLWAFPMDTPNRTPDVLPVGFLGLITRVARGARRVIAPSESVRSTYEGLVPQASGKTVVMPVLEDSAPVDFSCLFPPIIADSEIPRHARDVRTKVVLAGADFKFASDIIEALADSPNLDFDAITFASNWERDDQLTLDVCAAADVIIAEFCSPNANWLAHHLRSDQRLIIHLHGYELRADYSADLAIDRVHKVVVPSEFYVEEAIERRGWPREKLMVIPNGVSSTDLDRPKLPEARFHLGIIGYVPFLKRPDRALDLLELLLEHDDQYYLHFKGNAPWAYNWEWKKAPNQDAYRAFFRRAGSSPLLSEHVVFEPFSPDMGNWLRKIGWVLSPSVRETFHLAAMEGAASGAPPIVWERQGAKEIFSREFVFPNHRSAGDFILAHSGPEEYAELSNSARVLASNFDSRIVQRKWLAVVDEAGKQARATADCSPSSIISKEVPEERLVIDLVLELVQQERWEDALRILDKNIRLTAHSESTLKQVELTVRGVMELDARRFSLFRPAPAVQTQAIRDRPYVVRCPRAVPSIFLNSPSLDLNLDSGQALVLGAELGRIDDIQEDRSTYWVAPLAGCRFDRWLEYVASQIVVNFCQADTLVAEGPWWVATAAGLAASRLDVPLRWTALTDREFSIVSAVRSGSWPEGPVEGIVSSLLSEFPNCLDNDGGVRDARNTANSPTTRDEDQSPDSDRNLQITYVGAPNGTGAKALSQYGELNPLDTKVSLSDQLDVWTDALVVDSSAISRLKRTQVVTGVKAETALVKLVDRARAFGIPVLWLGLRTQDTYPTSVLRKMDFLATMDSTLIKSMLVLNPISIRSVQELGPHGEFVPEALRSCGLPVRNTVKRISSRDTVPHPDSTHVTGDLTPLSPSDGVSVILPTHFGADRIGDALQSISKQSLPAELIELVVVENGSDDGTLEKVRLWAEANPKIKVEAMRLDAPSVGAARNAGIKRATKDYITFLDDDDTLEPNALFSWWISAAEDIVVAGGLIDVTSSGQVIKNTPQHDRVKALNGGLSPLRARAGLLSLNGAKLIPRKRLAETEYHTDLKSGEDVVFMSSLLKHRDLYFSPAAPMNQSSYVRNVREGSVSRKEESFSFSVTDRLSVLHELHSTFEEAGSRPSDKAAIQVLARGQMQFIKSYMERNPSESNSVRVAVESAGLPTWITDIV